MPGFEVTRRRAAPAPKPAPSAKFLDHWEPQPGPIRLYSDAPVRADAGCAARLRLCYHYE
jgi:hypothetical protein